MTELGPSLSESCPRGTCKNDGCCDVYEQVFEDVQDDESLQEHYLMPRKLLGYSRYRDTAWCKCTLDMCLAPCPNHLLCGSIELFKWYLACNDGRCCTCNVVIGRKVEVVSVTEENWECPICFLPNEKACAFPDCPAKHKFCARCTRSVLFGMHMHDEHGFPYWEGGTNTCPICRHSFEASDGWRSYKIKK
jgi:hypothetical protein